MYEANPEQIVTHEPQLKTLPDTGARPAHSQSSFLHIVAQEAETANASLADQEITILREYLAKAHKNGETEAISAPLRKAETEERVMIEENSGTLRSYLAALFEAKDKNRGMKSPFSSLPTNALRQFIQEVIDNTPFENLHKQNLFVEIDGKSRKITPCSIPKELLNQLIDEAIDKALEDYERVLEFVTSPNFNTHGGWKKVEKWHGKMVRDAFFKTPFVEGQELATTLYKYYRDKDKKDEFNEMYKAVLREYTNQSYEHAVEYRFHPGFTRLGGWANVDVKWQRQFMQKAFAQDPFVESKQIAVSRNGETKAGPYLHYFSSKKDTSQYFEMMREIKDEYFDSMDRVIGYVTSQEFKKPRAQHGWGTVPPRWQRVFVILATMQSTKDKPNKERLTYTHHNGETIDLQNLNRYLRRQNRPKEFDEAFQIGLNLKERLKEHANASTDKPTSKQPARRFRSDDPRIAELTTWAEEKEKLPIEKELELFVRVEAKDQTAVHETVQAFTMSCILTALKFVRKIRGNNALLQAFISAGTTKLCECVTKNFDYKKGDARFSSYLYTVLNNLYTELLKTHTSGLDERSAKALMVSTGRVLDAKKRGAETPEEIRQITRQTTETIITVLALQFAHTSSLDEPIRNHGNKQDKDQPPLKDTIQDDRSDSTPGQIDVRMMIEEGFQALNTKEQIIIRQLNGLSRAPNRTPMEIAEAAGRPKLIQECETATQIFLQSLLEICKNSETIGTQEDRRNLQKLIEENDNPQEIISGKNQLGRILKGETGTGTIRDIFPYALKTLKPTDAILITEMFHIQPHKQQIGEELGKIFGVTHQMINTIKKRAMRKIEKRLKNRFGQEVIAI